MRLVVVAILASLAGCTDWPRMGNLPAEDGVPASGGAASLVDISWQTLDSPDLDNDQPNSQGVPERTLAPGDGVVVEAQLNGIGWDNSRVPSPLSDVACTQDDAVRTPVDDGDYIGDVDFLRLTAAEPGTLCAEIVLDQSSVGWDLAVRPVDTCGIPTAGPVDGLGVAVGGAQGGWQIQLQKDETVALSFAGYDPNDLSLLVGYTLTVALVPNAADGTLGLCPEPPDEGSR